MRHLDFWGAQRWGAVCGRCGGRSIPYIRYRIGDRRESAENETDAGAGAGRYSRIILPYPHAIIAEDDQRNTHAHTAHVFTHTHMSMTHSERTHYSLRPYSGPLGD